MLGALRGVADGERVAVGVGPSLALALGASIDGLRTFPSLAGARRAIPATPADLWIWLRGDDRGALYHLRRRVEAVLAPAFEVALFRFTLPVSGAYYWCPAMAGGRLDLRPLGL